MTEEVVGMTEGTAGMTFFLLFSRKRKSIFFNVISLISIISLI
ncbi:MAG TPA: hypothetical protein P5239_10080 [Victivallales bacterium]|nr:hypothetical protein [Victivallales bacterium]